MKGTRAEAQTFLNLDAAQKRRSSTYLILEFTKPFLRSMAGLAFFLSIAIPMYPMQSMPTQASAANPPIPVQWFTMPMPANVQVDLGHSFNLDQSFSLKLNGYTEPRLNRAVERFMATLSRQTGMPFSQGTTPVPAKLIITTDHASKNIQELGEDESYTLDITEEGIELKAATPLGVMHGLETLVQAVVPSMNGFEVPAAKIQDKPRFPWRGLMIDSCRHWMPMEVILRNLDGMAAVKMNVLHWHLSENQGFRVESKKYPKLHELGSDGNYYTQQQIREVIEYAHDRGIRVVPEFDIPGHSTAWFVGYPELASAPGPYELDRRWGVFDPAMDPTNEQVYKFLDGFIGEMSGLFPDAFFHIGGDEVNGKQWNANEKSHNLKDDHGLQAYFNQRVQKIVQKHGKIMMGWDEVLHPDLPKETVIHSWRGQKSLAEAAKQGYRGLLSSGWYLDLSQPTYQHYAVDPLSGDAATLTDEEKARILGGESCMWAEYISPETIDSRIWPRNAAIAERLWSPQENLRDVDPLSWQFDPMYARLERVSARLTFLGLQHETNYLPMLQRIAGVEGVHWLKMVADFIEPVKGYKRGRAQKYFQSTPLNRLVDTARPESLPARKLSQLVGRVLNSNTRTISDDERVVRAQLEAWKALANSQYMESKGSLLQEAVPVAKQMSIIGGIGLEALDKFKSGQSSNEEWRKQQQLLLDEAKNPINEVLIMVVPAIEQLVKASGK